MGISSSFIISKRARRLSGAPRLFIVGLMVAGILSGCQAREAVKPAGAEQALGKALAKTEKLKSYHFSSITKIGPAGRAKRITISGDWQSPDRLKMTIKSQGLEREAMMIGKDTFTKAATETAWRQRSGRAPAEQRNIASTINVLKKFKSASFAGDSGAGKPRINAVYDLAAFVGGGLGGAENQKVVARLRLDEAGYIKTVSIKQKNIKVGNSSIGFVMTIALSRYNRAEEINPPPTP